MTAPEPPPGPEARPSDGLDGIGPIPKWWIYRGTGVPNPYLSSLAERLPPAPPWRDFSGGPDQPDPPSDDGESDRVLGAASERAPRPLTDHETRAIDAVNAALILRRPLLVTGDPGVGKSALAHRVARELGLGRVLRWPITSGTGVRRGLYEYDPIARIHDISADVAAAPETDQAASHPIGQYLRLGPLGTALLPHRLPRVLLIDEFDKGDVDLADDLLDVLENGRYQIPELARLRSAQREVIVPTDDPGVHARVYEGEVRCHAFPFIVITSNGERPFPAAFRRRCLPLRLEPPSAEQLADIVSAHFLGRDRAQSQELIAQFTRRRDAVHGLSIDQLLNSVHLASSTIHGNAASLEPDAWNRVLDLVWQRLTEAGHE